MAKKRIFLTFTLLFFTIAILLSLFIQELTFYLNRDGLKALPIVYRSVPKGNQIGCKMPSVDPFDQFILPYIEKAFLFCETRSALTTVDKDGRLKKTFLSTPLKDLTIPKEDIECLYSWVRRGGRDESVIHEEDQVLPNNGVLMTDINYVANVTCFKKSNLSVIYRNVHINIPPFKRISDESNKPKVFILVIESLSRLSFLRFMPKTKKMLDLIGNFHQFRALNRVEENSFPNSMALITGIAVTDHTASSMPNIFWDNRLPFIWNKFKEKGYITGFMEDQPMVGLFSYYNRGFQKPPTDFYPVPFWSHMYPNGSENLYELLTNRATYCYENAGKKIDLFLKISLDFADKLRFKPYFMYAFYSQMTHESFSYHQLVDKPLSRFLKRFKSLFQEDTIFIIAGDHGPRVGPQVDTPMGRMEGSLPFFTIRIPDRLNRLHPHLRKYLALNENRLTSWFDIHQMLIDIAKGNFSEVEIRDRIPSVISPFREEVPIERDCSMANISPVFCACNGRVGVNLIRGGSQQKFCIDAAREAFHHIRSLLNGHELCQETHVQFSDVLEGYYIYPEPPQQFSLNQEVLTKILVKSTKSVVQLTAYRWRNSTSSDWGEWQVKSTKNNLHSPEFIKILAQKICSDNNFVEIN